MQRRVGLKVFSLVRLKSLLISLLLLCHLPTAWALEPVSEDQLLLLELRMDRYTLSDTLSAYTSESGVLVSLTELAASLNFPIELDAEASQAEGWFIDESRRFKLQIYDTGATVWVDGETIQLPASAARVHGNDILLEYSTVADWLPVRLELDFAHLRLNAVALEPLAVRQHMQRSRPEFMGPPTDYQPQMPLHEVPYKLFTVPSVDVSLSNSMTRHEDSDEVEQQTHYTIMASGDLAYMNSQLYMTGNGKSDKTLDTIRLKFERDDPNGEIFGLGPLGASKIQVGDISPSAFPIVGTHPVELGVSIERTPQGRQFEYDKVDINGDVEPGWEIELYWNGNLTDRQIAGPDGRYDFENVPLFLGNNTFELVFYGPDGQQRRENRSYYVGPNTQRAGRLDYQFHATQKGRNVFIEGENYPLPTSDGTLRLTSRFLLDLGKGFSLGAGMHSVAFDGARHNYTNYELRSLLPGMSLTLNSIEDSEGGRGYESVVQSIIGKVSLRGSYLQNDGMALESELNSTDKRLSEAELSLNTHFGRTPVNFTYRQTERELSDVRELSNSFTIPLRGAFLSNTLSWEQVDSAGQTNDSIDGSLQWTSSGQPLQWLLRSSYEVEPENELTELFARANLRINRRMRMNLEYTHLPQSDYDLYRAGMIWKMDEALLIPSLSYDSDGNYVGYVNLSLGLGANAQGDGVRMSAAPVSPYGSVAARVFVDDNANGVLDQGESPAKGVTVRSKPGYRLAKSDEDGYLLLDGLAAYQPVDILMEPDSLEDDMRPSNQSGVGMTPRPGRQVQLNLPVLRTIDSSPVRTGMIQGTLFRQLNDQRKPLADVEVWLVDSEDNEVQRVLSDDDGFFQFTRLPVGTYEIEVPSKYRHIYPEVPTSLKITAAGEMLSGNDLIVMKSKVASSKNVQVLQGTEKPPAAKMVAPVKVAPVTVKPMVEKKADKVSLPKDSGVQLGAFYDGDMAKQERLRIQKRYSELVKGLKISLTSADLGDKGILNRLILGDLSRNEAREVCDKLKARGQDCFIVTLPKRR